MISKKETKGEKKNKLFFVLLFLSLHFFLPALYFLPFSNFFEFFFFSCAVITPFLQQTEKNEK